MENWLTVVCEVLGKESLEYAAELSILLLLTDQGIKPSFLWNYPSPEPIKLASFLQTLQSKDLLKNSLKILVIESDCFVINLDALLRALVTYLTSSQTWLVDISTRDAKVAPVSLHETYNGYFISMLRQLGVADPRDVSLADDATKVSPDNSSAPEAPSSADNAIASIVHITLPDAVNLSTIFGCILGYPQVYWWEKDSTGSALSGMPLKVYSFEACCRLLDDTEIEAFSFSVPEALEPEVRASIKQWGNGVNSRVEQAATFHSAKFNADPVLCLKVGL